MSVDHEQKNRIAADIEHAQSHASNLAVGGASRALPGNHATSRPATPCNVAARDTV